MEQVEIPESLEHRGSRAKAKYSSHRIVLNAPWWAKKGYRGGSPEIKTEC